MNTASGLSKYSIHDITADIIARAGLAVEEATELYMKLNSVCRAHPGEREETKIWKELTESGALKPCYPHEVHQLIYYSIYSDWDVSARGPPPYWFPSELNSKNTNLGRVMETFCPKLLGSSYQDPIKSFPLFQKFSVQHPEVYYSIVIKELSLKFQETHRRILDTSDKCRKGGNWFPGAVLNIAECCILPTNTTKKKDNDIAMVWRNEGSEDLSVKYMSYKEFRDQVRMVANALDMTFTKGDVIAIDMPMTVTAVVVYLAIVLAGYVVVTIADSFAANEIATRMRISNAKGIFTQDFIIRGGRKYPLYSRVIEACSCRAIVVPASEKEIGVQLRKQDLSWNDFISSTSNLMRPFDYSPVYQPSHATTNILFSSGTTGDPKAIPWTQLSPIKSASEAWAHIDMQSKDIFCWPTNLGWVMGPSVLYSAFLNGAALALYHGSPLDRSFGKFVQDARVTLLGTVPSMVKAWKSSKCMDGLDWSSIRAFATTGEASDIDDDLWLTSRSNYKPLFELCGGTELASSFILGCFLQPQAYATFSTPSMSTGFVILDKEGVPYPDDQPCIGEIALFPLLMGASDRLLNADHDKIYFHGMPLYKGMNLRRHGDIVQRTVGGYYIVHGRADDTMNLGGIKTSSVEIERVCNRADERVLETAAVSIKLITGGPEQLVVLVVLKPGSSSSDFEPNYLKTKFQKAIQKNLNPLFKVRAVKIVPDFPRTASNKLLRRVLRDQVRQEFLCQSKL